LNYTEGCLNNLARRNFIGKNEVANRGNSTPASYSQKDSDSTNIANVTDIHREIYEPYKTTVEDVHSETVVSIHSLSKKK